MREIISVENLAYTYPGLDDQSGVVVFEDMIHYTTVKTNMFNGISHPSIAFLRDNGELQMLRVFRYEDYRDRMC